MTRELAQYHMMLAIAKRPNKAKQLVMDHYKNNLPACKRKLSFDNDQLLQFEHSLDKDTRTGLPKKVRLIDDSTNRIIFHYEAADEKHGTSARSVLCYPNNTAVEFRPETIVWPFFKAPFPLDCLARVFSFLHPETLLKCRLVSSMWCAIASDNSVWRYHIRHLSPIPLSENLFFVHYVRGTFRKALHHKNKERLAAFLSSPAGESYFVHIVQTNTGTSEMPQSVERPSPLERNNHWRIRIRWRSFAYGIMKGDSNILTTTLIPYDILSWIRCYLINLKK